MRLFAVSLALLLTSATPSPPGVFDVRDFGAVGDGALHNNSAAINAAVAAAAAFYAASGGAAQGTVLVAGGGVFLSGRIELLSGALLSVAAGTVLKASANVSDFPDKPVEGRVWAFLYSNGASDIGVAGGGVVDGNFEALIGGFDATNDEFVPLAWPNCSGECRPRLAMLTSSTRVTLHDVTFRGSPDWTTHILNCTSVHIYNFAALGDQRWPNNDGIDIDSSSHVLVEQSLISVGDDGVCIKGSSPGVEVYNVTVRNCSISSRSSAVKFGSNNPVPTHSLVFEDLLIFDSNRALALQTRDGGHVYDVMFRRIVINATRFWPAKWWGDGGPIYISSMLRTAADPGCVVTNITFEDIVARSQNAAVLSGRAPGKQLTNVTLRNVTIVIDRLPSWNYSTDSVPPAFPNIEYDPAEVRPTRVPMTGWMPGLYAENVEGLVLDGLNVTFVNANYQGYWGSECVNTTAAGFPVSVIGNSVCVPPQAPAAAASQVPAAAAPQATAAAAPAAAPQAPPTVIFNVIIDDLGFANVAWRSPNPPENSTPRLAALKASGVSLERQYNHFTCTPSRSSFMSGRLPVHVQTTLANPDVQNAGLPVNMTALPIVLARAGYKAHIAGKWDLGFARPQHTPELRGYATSLIYAEHMNNYWTYEVEPTGTSCPQNQTVFDLWDSGSPARSFVGSGTYIEDLFLERTLATVAAFDPGSGGRLFLDYRPHSMHWPLMLKEADFVAFANVSDDEGGCGARFYGDPMWPGAGPGNRNFSCRRQYQAMLAALDRNIGRVVDALAAKGLWDDTLMTFFSDNGGCVELSENAGNNFPLRGGKYGAFEGGIRVTAFLSGGYLPAAARGTTSTELVHVADYFVTLCVRAGLPLAECTADPLAAAAGLPPIDGVDFWPAVVLGAGPSPRSEIPVDEAVLIQRNGSALYKLMLGAQGGAGLTGRVFPNSTGANPMAPTLDCGATGCLFEVASDESESDNLAAQRPDLVAAMTARLAELRKGFYSNEDRGVDVDGCAGKGDCACWAAANVWGGFLGPWQKA